MSQGYDAVLTIAGSDSGGGAGIQADIKSISANGGYAASVITATTAQNTQGVTDIHALPIEHLSAQLDSVMSDIDFGAIKVGMLHSQDVVELVQSQLRTYSAKNIVIDPVMVATSGDRLIDDSALESLKYFLPDALLITPNIPEAEILLGHKVTEADIEQSAIELGRLFQTSVLLKGGRFRQEAMISDILYLAETDSTVRITQETVDTENTHGTGCSLSSAIATFVSRGMNLQEACESGCAYVNAAIKAGKDRKLGQGNGPIHHFFRL